MKTIKIDIVSDVVCPWCYLGKARLERALAAMKDVKAEMAWRPYQLDPTIPRGGVDRQEYMEAKFGTGPRLGEIQKQLESFGREVGIRYNFEAIKVSPNTMDAHRLIRWAAQVGADVQGKVVDRLFKLYFTEGADIGKQVVLIKAGTECGMDPAILKALLPTDAEEAGVIGEIAASKQLGIQGVPCFIFNRKYAVSGAQSPEVLIEAMHGAMQDAPVA